MTNVPISGSASVYTLWKVETAFKTPATPDAHLGLDTNFSARLNNNVNPRRGFKGSATSGRDVQKFNYGKAEYELSMDFDLNDPSFFEHLLGDKTGSVYSGEDIPDSVTIANCLDHVTTDRDEIYSGCVFEQATIRGAMNEPITVSLSMKAATMDYDSTLTSNAAINAHAPFTFTEAIFEMPNASVLSNIVEGFDISITNNFQFLYGASREATAYVPGDRVYTIKLTTKQVDDVLINAALGGTTISPANPTESATLEITLTRPDNDTLILLFTLTPISTYNLTQALNEPVGEDIELIAASLTVTESIA